MKADKNALQSILPAQIFAYLHSKGARKKETIPDKAIIFEYCGVELLVPLATHFADYALRMSEILSGLEKIENRSQLLIFEDLTCIGFDSICVRYVPKDSLQETLTFISSIDFLEKARDLLTSTHGQARGVA